MMTGNGAVPALASGVGLLERAVNYALGSVHTVTPEALAQPTPCLEWDLRALLVHLADSMAALHEAIDVGYVQLDPPSAGQPVDPVAMLRDRACQLLGAWTNAGPDQPILVAGCPVTTGLVTGTGAVEIAVHGWDVAAACGRDRPIPAELAGELLPLVTLLVGDADRPARFAAPVRPPPGAERGELLVAFLGRHPASPVDPSGRADPTGHSGPVSPAR